MRRSILSLLTLLVLFTAPVWADVHLLGSPQVRRELQLSPDVAARVVRNLNEEARLNQGGVMSLETARALERQRRRTPPQFFEQRAINCLSPAQKQRLKQIELQQQGPFLFDNWPAAHRVGLTARQFKMLKRQFDVAFTLYNRRTEAQIKKSSRQHAVFDRKRNVSREAALQHALGQLGDQYTAHLEEILARTLTPAQKAKWHSLCGKPFRANLTYDIKMYPMN